MKAVNLIPSDERRGAGSPAKSGIAVYALLAVLGVVVLVLASLTATNRSISDKQSKLAQVERDAGSAEARAGDLKAFTAFAAMREKRQETVAAIAAGRIDWSRSLHELARTLPSDTWVSSIRATTTPSVALSGGTADPMRQKLAQPAVELNGCTATQATVARVIAAMRRMSGVQRVSLSSSKKAAKGAAGSASGDAAASSRGCGTRTQFSLTVFYAPQAAPAAAAPATTNASATTPSTTPSTGASK